MLRHAPARLALLLLLALPASSRQALEDAHLARFAEGAGPSVEGDVLHVLDAARTNGQSNAVAFDRADEGRFRVTTLRCRLRVLEGGEGGAIAFLDTSAYGARGPAPFSPTWVAPRLRGSFAVALDVHDPPTDEPFGPDGNIDGHPEREVALSFDGRELVKRVAPVEFRGEWVDCEVVLEHVVGGAEASVRLAGAPVFERYFVPGCLPYESRLALGAETGSDVTTAFDVRDMDFTRADPVPAAPAPLHVRVLDHVLTDNATTAYAATVDLPPMAFELGRVILTLDLHDAGEHWDEWDRNGTVSVVDASGRRWPIVPFITSYRTPCHWEVDVTAFRPWLAGPTTIEAAAGTGFYKDRGFEMSVALDFYPGRLAPAPFAIEPLWVGVAHHGASDPPFQGFFDPRRVAIDPTASAARLFVAVTGHSQVGEFTPSERTVVFRPVADGEPALEERFTSRLWKDDNDLNPNRPQFGTWKYARAGWAPGDVVHPWWIDLKPAMKPGATAELCYEPGPYDFSGEDERPSDDAIAQASQVVASYLILYREPTDTIPLPRLRVTNVAAGSHAAEVGLREGDWLVSYDGVALATIADLRQAIDAAQAAGKARIAVVAFRGAERLEVEVGPGKVGVNLAER